MAENRKLFFKSSGSIRRLALAALALALLPAAAQGMESTPRPANERASSPLPLPPILYLDSMRWMDWQTGTATLKIDTLLLPDTDKPGVFHLPPNSMQDLLRMS